MLNIFKTSTFIWVYFYAFKLANCGTISDVDNSSKTFSCVVFYSNDENSQLHCAVSFQYLPNYVNVSDCVNSDNNVLISMRLEKDNPSSAITNVSFTCTSNNPLSVKANFNNGIPKIQYTNIRTEKIAENTLTGNVSIDKYKLHIVFPKYPVFNYLRGDTVKYTISDSNDQNVELNIFVEFFTLVSSEKTCRMYNLHDHTPIDTSHEEIILIPCIAFTNETNVRIKRRAGSAWNLLPVDNLWTVYDKWKGFLLNTTRFIEKEFELFQCEIPGCTTHSFVLTRPDNGFSPKNDVYLHGQKFNFILGKKEEKSQRGAKLSINQYNRTTGIKLDEFNRDHSKPWINDIVEYSEYLIGQNAPMYFVTAEVPYLDEKERQQFTGWKNNDSNQLVFYRTNESEPVWNIMYDFADVPFYFSHDHNAFICEGLKNVVDDVDISFMAANHWECKNILQCEVVLSNCFKEDNRNVEIPECIVPTDENNLCSKIRSNFEQCTEVGKISENADSELCKAIRPAKKGIAWCQVQLHEQNFNIYYFYFQGFDNKMYVDVELNEKPPLKAILKLTSLNKENHFWTEDYFTFRCEAHSFLYANGIQWFLKYKNGSILHPSNNSMSLIETQNQDEYNPESNAKFYFDDITLVEVICAVPLLRTDGMDLISLEIEMFDQVEPKFVSHTKIYLKESGDNQIIPFQKFGIPIPAIIWTKNGEKIDDTLTILDGHVLVFPRYDEAFLGEYTCNAGNVLKTFTVGIKSSTGQKSPVPTCDANRSSTVYKGVSIDRLSVWYLRPVCCVVSPQHRSAGFFKSNTWLKLVEAEDQDGPQTKLVAALGTSAIIIGLVLIFYFRLKTGKKTKQIKEIVRFVEGIETNEVYAGTNVQNEDPLQRPFKKNYELQRNDFTINLHRPLGCGEFGEVYQGTLNKNDEPIAVKMLKKNAKIEHLKALASELKILMFIGEHENLVKLKGAYKQELERGILYVVVEFCGLGSLESYLRTNKYLFVKCPQLRCLTRDPAEYDCNPIHGNAAMPETVPSFHSLLTLLKWCKQITAGMEHLGLKNVVHSDLATRNVLLTSEGNAKVTDFGLSRRMYNYSEYVKTADDPIPWQWNAPESIVLKQYSSKSDVWAYGIAMWEIFTFGEIPYPTFSFNEVFLEMLRGGMRNKQPKYAPNAIFRLMKRCWEYDPNTRPSFSYLKHKLRNIIDNPHQFSTQIEVQVHNNNQRYAQQRFRHCGQDIQNVMNSPYRTINGYVLGTAIEN